LESISNIRQMMAESKFYEAQKSLELLLTHASSAERVEVLAEYISALEHQSKILPSPLVIELAEALSKENTDASSALLLKLTPPFDHRRVLLIKINNAASKGQLQDLYHLISELQTYLYEVKAPAIPEVVTEFIRKYFKADFQLKLQELSLSLMLSDLARSEKIIQDLLLGCVEKTSVKGFQEKLLSLEIILAHREGRDHLDVYQNLCKLLTSGVQNKSDYKKAVECVIYFEDFKLQTMILNFLDQVELTAICETYAAIIRKHRDYDFVYFDKFYPSLKRYFVKPKTSQKESTSAHPEIDLSLEDYVSSTELPSQESSYSLDEDSLIQTLKYRDYSTEELLEIAVSFIQSEMNVAGLRASALALEKAPNTELFLKSAFLKMTCLLKTSDFRGVLDLAFAALERAEKQEDILSFLYTQAEAYQRLGQKREAKKTLQRIIHIDGNYRLARERLERLNEV
jgi:hypothetical protein